MGPSRILTPLFLIGLSLTFIIPSPVLEENQDFGLLRTMKSQQTSDNLLDRVNIIH